MRRVDRPGVDASAPSHAPFSASAGPVPPARLALWERLAPRLMPPSSRDEWRAILQEPDEALLHEALWSFAAKQERAEAPERAAELYAYLAEAAAASKPDLARRARERLAFLQGSGPVRLRVESLLHRFSREACDPANLMAMVLAGSVYRLTRAGVLSRLLASPAANPLTRGFGARALAAVSGFALEAPVFTLGGKAAGAALGRPQAWDSESFGRELASSYLVLGGLKLAGWGSQAVYRRLVDPVGANLVFAPMQGGGGRTQGSPLQLLFQQGGMLSGILIGHSLEERLGLRPRQDGATTLTDSLATLLQFHVAGRLTCSAFGEGFHRWERGLDALAERVAQNGPPLFRPPAPVLLGATPARASLASPPVADSGMLWAMSGIRDAASGRPPRRPEPSHLPSVASALRGLRSLPRHSLPRDEVHFLLRFSRKLEAAGLKDNAYLVLEKALELARRLEYDSQAADCLGRVGEAMADLSYLQDAQRVFAEARRRIERTNAHSRPHLLGDLWAKQRRAQDPDAADTLKSALRAARRQIEAGQSSNAESLAIRAAAEGELALARDLIDELAVGHRAFAVSELASRWAREGFQHQTVARAILLEAKGEIHRGAKLRENNYPVYWLHRLGKALLAAGPDYRDDVHEVALEMRSYLKAHIPDATAFASQMVDAVSLLAGARKFHEARAIVATEFRDPGFRSKALAAVLVELGRAERMEDAEALLHSERLLIGDRVSVSLELVSLYRGKQGAWTPDAKRLLKEVRELLLRHEFSREGLSRFEALLRTAGMFVEAGDRVAGEELYEAARQAIAGDVMIAPERAADRYAELALERAARLGFAKIPENRPRLFETLRRAARQGEAQRAARLATLLGFCEDGFEYAREEIASLPEDYRLWARIHLMEGASLLPRDTAGRKALAQEVREILLASQESAAPLAPRVHRRAAQLLLKLDAPTWLRIAHDKVRSTLGLRPEGLQAFVWRTTGRTIAFPEQDPIFYQTLFWLARSGHRPSQGMVREWLERLDFPAAQRRVLVRALRGSEGLASEQKEKGKILH